MKIRNTTKRDWHCHSGRLCPYAYPSMRAARERISSMALPWLRTVASSFAMRTLQSHLDAVVAGGSTGCSGFGAVAGASAGGGGGGAIGGTTGAGGAAGAMAAAATGSARSIVESCSTGRHSLHCSAAPAGTSRHAHTRISLLVRSEGRVSTQRPTWERVRHAPARAEGQPHRADDQPTRRLVHAPPASTGKAASNEWTAMRRGEHGRRWQGSGGVCVRGWLLCGRGRPVAERRRRCAPRRRCDDGHLPRLRRERCILLLACDRRALGHVGAESKEVVERQRLQHRERIGALLGVDRQGLAVERGGLELTVHSVDQIKVRNLRRGHLEGE
eukprot:scaffold78441_cov63-Phaeocystis_antarctica.AAC.3